MVFVFIYIYIYLEHLATTQIVFSKNSKRFGKGQMGVSTNGVSADCMCFFDRGTFRVFPFTYLYICQKCQGVPFSPIRQNSLLLQRPHSCRSHLSRDQGSATTRSSPTRASASSRKPGPARRRGRMWRRMWRPEVASPPSSRPRPRWADPWSVDRWRAVTFVPMPVPWTACRTDVQNKWVQQEVCRTLG